MSTSSDTPLPACDPTVGAYGYNPSLAAAIVFCIVFGCSTTFSTVLAIQKRLWYLTIATGGLLETLGWIARAIAHDNVCSSSAFIMQICCLIIGPVFWSATLYIILGILISYRPENSPLKSRSYLFLFGVIDFISLLLQAIGGGMAAGAKTKATQSTGTKIMVTGVLFQVAGMTCFVLLGLLFIVKSWKVRSLAHITLPVLFILALATLLIFLRNGYRCIELLEGWQGHLNLTQGYIIGFDGVPMVLCSLVLFCLQIIDKDGLMDRIPAESSDHPEKSILQ